VTFFALLRFESVSCDALAIEGVDELTITDVNLRDTHCTKGSILEFFQYCSSIEGFLLADDGQVELHLVELSALIERHIRELIFRDNTLINKGRNNLACQLSESFISLVSLYVKKDLFHF